MMEQAHAGEGHGHAITITGFNYIIIPNRTAGLGNIANPAAASTLNVIAIGEKGVTPQR